MIPRQASLTLACQWIYSGIHKARQQIGQDFAERHERVLDEYVEIRIALFGIRRVSRCALKNLTNVVRANRSFLSEAKMQLRIETEVYKMPQLMSEKWIQ